jgi:predicted histone-like DNA-binding protein
MFNVFMPVLIKVSQNKNDKTAAFGKWYGRVVSTKTMSYQELCKHMSEHNSVYGEDVCLGVANKLQNCMLEQLLEGKKVQFGELGVFYLSVKSTGANKEEDFNLGVNINGLFLCFAPSRTDVNNLSSKMLKKKATFMNVKDLVESKPKSSTSGSSNGSTDSGSNGSTNSGGSGNNGGSNPEPTTVSAPVFSGETQFTESTQVTISGPDGATIHYTTDGTTPTAESTQYAEPLTFSQTTTLKAIAIKDGVSSEVTSRIYTKTSNDDGMGQD